MSEFDVKTTYYSDQSTSGRWVFSHLKRHWLLIVVLFIGAFGNAALAAAVPVFIGNAFDAALETPANLAAIGGAAIGLIISQAIRAVLQLGRNFSSAVIGPLLGGFLADSVSYQLVFGLSAAGRMLGMVLFTWLTVRIVKGEAA